MLPQSFKHPFPVKKILFRILPVSILFIFVLQFQSCRDDDFDTSPYLRLEFSTDSLLFDTVFTDEVGSATRQFKVFNKHNSRINISSVELAGGKDSYFRINAAGRAGTRIENLEIEAKDSMYVFVEVTIDPVGQDLPLIIKDSVVFNVNNNQQDVKLIAWGQDAHFITPNYTDTVHNIDYHIVTQNTVWSGPKPYVVEGIVVVAPHVNFRITEGTHVHFRNKAAMMFLEHSSLNIEGTLDAPVYMQGDRLEHAYSDLPGQWGYIYLTAASGTHQIDYAVIKNATYGIVLDSVANFSEPTLKLRNTIIKNMDQTGLEFRGSWVEAENVVVANCGTHAIYMGLGGNYDFRHTTVANYYSLPGDIRQTPSLVFNNYYVDTTNTVQVREFEKAYFGNSIIYGSLQEEIMLDLYPDNNVASFAFDHSLIRTSFHHQYGDLFDNTLFNEQPRFVSASDNDYRLMEDSPVIGEGDPDIAIHIPLDILGNDRTDRVDMGAFQYYEMEDENEEDE